jgi:hypothetical protein
VRDPLWRIKDRILSALAMCSIFEMATDTIPDMVLPLTVTRRGAAGGDDAPTSKPVC